MSGLQHLLMIVITIFPGNSMYYTLRNNLHIYRNDNVCRWDIYTELVQCWQRTIMMFKLCKRPILLLVVFVPPSDWQILNTFRWKQCLKINHTEFQANSYYCFNNFHDQRWQLSNCVKLHNSLIPYNHLHSKHTILVVSKLCRCKKYMNFQMSNGSQSWMFYNKYSTWVKFKCICVVHVYTMWSVNVISAYGIKVDYY